MHEVKKSHFDTTVEQQKTTQCNSTTTAQCNSTTTAQCNSTTLLNAIVQQLLNAVQCDTTQRTQEVTLLSTCTEESIAMQ